MKVFDIESDGLLPGQCKAGQEITKLHCINVIDREDGREYRFTDHEFYEDLDHLVTNTKCPRDGTIADGVAFLKGEHVGGHNIIGYATPAIEYVLGINMDLPATSQFDSSILGKLAVPNLKDKDFANIRKGKLKIRAGGNALRDWALRLDKRLKQDFKPGDYGHTWKTMPFTQIMDEYCMNDVRANVDVIEFMEKKLAHCPLAVDLELGTAGIIKWQERTGIAFDVKAAESLAAELYIKLHELENTARSAFAPFYMKDGRTKTFKKPMKRKVKQGDWKEWCSGEHQPIKLIDFNPGSRVQIENRLRWKYDWEPTELTSTGRAEINEETLGTLPFEEAQTITDFLMVQKRLSQLAEGKQAWLKVVKEDGRIYGRVDQLGTGTGRMSHFGPNLAQVPKLGKPYGGDCRALFVADDDKVIVGCDADALELCILAHFLARFDGGAYVETVLSGSKEKGTDMHTRNQAAIGLDLRDTAKTWFYAFLYGSGEFNLGTIVMSEWNKAKLLKFYAAFPPGQKRRSKIAALGKRGKLRFLASMPSLKKLLTAVHSSAERGYLRGLDGRHIPVRSKHSALNFLCQGAGALVMKKALIIMFDGFAEEGLDVRPLLNVHDEVQLSTTNEESKHVGRIAARAITEAAEAFNLRCPISGSYDIGSNWCETH